MTKVEAAELHRRIDELTKELELKNLAVETLTYDTEEIKSQRRAALREASNAGTELWKIKIELRRVRCKNVEAVNAITAVLNINYGETSPSDLYVGNIRVPTAVSEDKGAVALRYVREIL